MSYSIVIVINLFIMVKNAQKNTLNLKKFKKAIESGLKQCYNQDEKLINGKRVREKPKNLYSNF
jgi:hypothetical protein